MINPLDLYARFEPMIPFEKEIDYLHRLFLSKLEALSVKSVLDVGCGSGLFLTRLNERSIAAKGIDLSGEMIAKAKAKGANAEKIDLKDETESYDALTAVFDVINYLKSDELIDFFALAHDRLNPNGAFIFDVNSRFGFRIAKGDLILEKEGRLAFIHSDFTDEKLLSRFCLFEPIGGNRYDRFDWQIEQYYHSGKTIKKALKKAGFSAIKKSEIYLYGDKKSDKTLFIAKV
ncbi:MAG: methyltransferase domain-containing protein [Helicobacteraceae bacterium]|jgi:predicted TPR repeat methyltransferase|nr:methyltransferase domain-containing protein [Helicobacteraceae bacterium]